MFSSSRRCVKRQCLTRSKRRYSSLTLVPRMCCSHDRFYHDADRNACFCFLGQDVHLQRVCFGGDATLAVASFRAAETRIPRRVLSLIDLQVHSSAVSALQLSTLPCDVVCIHCVARHVRAIYTSSWFPFYVARSIGYSARRTRASLADRYQAYRYSHVQSRYIPQTARVFYMSSPIPSAC